MICCTVPSGVRKVADLYKSLCGGRLSSFNSFCALISLFLFDLETLSDLVRTCPWSHSVSDLSRAIDGFDANRVMRRIRSRILKRYQGKLNKMDFCLAIDDTANPRYGKTIFISTQIPLTRLVILRSSDDEYPVTAISFPPAANHENK